MRSVLLALALVLVPMLSAGPGPGPGMAHAQTQTGPDYDRWEATAARASDAIETARASSGALQELRDQLVGWREQFFAARNINQNAIATTEAQLKALGPLPEDGFEADDIAAQRAQLTDDLARLRAPAKNAELAYSRADGLIRGIDRIFRERQADELLRLGPSPVNPKHWPAGVEALLGSFEIVRDELLAALQTDVQRTSLRKHLPLVAVLVVIGLVLLVRGRFWVELSVRLVVPRGATPGRWIITLLMSLGEILVPFLGVLALTRAAYMSGIIGLRTDMLIAMLVPSTLIFLIARWLALRSFPRQGTHRLPLMLEAEDRRAGRLYGGALGVVIGVFYFVQKMGEISSWSPEARNVVLFPVVVTAGLLLIRMAALLSKHSRKVGVDDTQDTFRNRLTWLLSRGLVVLAAVSSLLAAVGYFAAAEALLLPSLLSIMGLSALLLIQRMFTEIYVLLSGSREGAADELVPVLAGLTLVVISLPAFALIWGARVADLQELWIMFTNGISFGGMTISPTIFMTLASVFAAGYVATRLLQGTLKNTLLPKTRMDAGGRNAVVSGVGYIGIFLATLIAVTSAGIDLSSLAIVAGALSVGIGFGLQNIVSNFVSGIILLIERPISQGDWIEVNGQHGTVREISVRSTRIETFDRSDLIIPNSDLVSGTVTNYTRGNTVGRCIVTVGVSYAADTRQVESILMEIAKANPMVLINPPPSVIFKNIGADAFEFDVRMILRDINWVMNVKSEVNHEIAKRFAAEGIEMPYPQRDLWLRNPEVLFAGGRPAAPAPSAPKFAKPDEGSGEAQHLDAGGDADGADR